MSEYSADLLQSMKKLISIVQLEHSLYSLLIQLYVLFMCLLKTCGNTDRKLDPELLIVPKGTERKIFNGSIATWWR